MHLNQNRKTQRCRRRSNRDVAGQSRDGCFKRLFFALWPDEAVRARIQEMAAGLPLREGRRVSQDNLHITLVFLGNVAESTCLCAEAVADGVTAKPFTLSLDQLGYWPRPRVVWLGTSVIPEELGRLESALCQSVTQCGIAADDRPYAPHMTLLRKVSHAFRASKVEPIEWRVEKFVLVESVTNAAGVQYQVLKRWDLGQGVTTMSGT